MGSIDIDLEVIINVQQPNASLYNFEGYISFVQNGKQQTQKVPIDVKNFLFKGAKIKNVGWILGIVLYSGTDTKIQQNGSEGRFKVSAMEAKLHKMIIVLFILQLFLTLICVVFKILIDGDKGKKFDGFVIGLQNFDDYKIDIWELYIRYFILLNSLIPISLIVNLEMVRLMQAYLIFENLDLKSKQLNRKCKISTTAINEELGEVEYVLTDKTGTLTQNKMILRGIVVGDKLFGGEFLVEESGEK